MIARLMKSVGLVICFLRTGGTGARNARHQIANRHSCEVVFAKNGVACVLELALSATGCA